MSDAVMQPAQSSAGKIAGLRQHLLGDLRGGLVSAVVALPQAIPLGVLAFAPLGPDHVGEGVIAGMNSAIFGGFAASLLGGSQAQISGPRASVSLIMAALLAQLLAQPVVQSSGGATLAVSLMFLSVLLAGTLQVGFGKLQFGRLIKYIPYPVIAGFMNGVAVLILAGQVNALLGLPGHDDWSAPLALLSHVQPWTVLVGAVTIGAILAAPRLVPAVPAPLVGLAVGSALYHAMRPVVGPAMLGPMVGSLPPTLPWPDRIIDFIQLPSDVVLPALAGVAGSILLLALVASVDSLLSAVALDTLSNERHDSERELIGQGAGNIIAACFGGVAATGSLARGAANWKAGGRTRLSGIIHSLALLLLMVGAGSLLEAIPLVVMAAIMVTVALSMLDGWSREMMWRLTGPSGHRREVAANLLVVLAVAVVTVLVNLMAAVAVGVAASMALFVRKMCKPVVRAVYDGRARQSNRVREHSRQALLHQMGDKICVLELEGPLFFGTADALRTQIEHSLEEAPILVLDFRRLSETDATGVRILQQIARRVTGAGGVLCFANLTSNGPRGAYMLDLAPTLAEQASWFDDLDTALEWAEDLLLHRYGPGPSELDEVPLSAMPLAEALTAEELGVFQAYLDRQSFKQGEVIFRRGEPGDRLYLIVRGSIGIYVPRDELAPVRLAAFNAGVVFGEMALIEHLPRSADAVADEGVVAFTLRAEQFERLQDDHPVIARKILFNISRTLAQRLRDTTNHLRALA